MQEITLQDLYQIAIQSKNSLYEEAASVGREPQIFLHWSAGHYGQVSPHYHINIGFDGKIYLMDDLTTILEHTWHQNTGAIGVTLAACAFANTNDLGDYNRIAQMTIDDLNAQQIPYEPPTQQQIEIMAQVIAILTMALELPCTYDYVRTHAEQADIDGYGPASTCERWDLAILANGDEWMSGGNILRGKGVWYQQNLQF